MLNQPTALAPPALNGAGTLSHAPRGTGGAIDGGVCDLAADQRGVERPVDGDLDNVAICDIGSVEFEPLELWLPVVNGD